MYEGELVLAQLMEHLPTYTFRRIIKRYDGDRKVEIFSCNQIFQILSLNMFERNRLDQLFNGIFTD